MSAIRRLDHVAVVVRDTDAALRTFADRFGLPVAHSESQERAGVRLTYLDCGNAYLQLVEPTDPDHELARWLDEHGEGLHHICFGVDDALAAAAELAPDGAPAPVAGSKDDQEPKSQADKLSGPLHDEDKRSGTHTDQ